MAVPIIGPEAAAKLASGTRKRGAAQLFRAFMAARSRYAEDQLAVAIARGATQYVILGAGLDTFAYRNPYPRPQLRVFEVDYPATQEWKRQRLAKAADPDSMLVDLCACGFRAADAAGGLAAAGFDAEKATFFSWLGVTMYLTEAARCPP